MFWFCSFVTRKMVIRKSGRSEEKILYYQIPLLFRNPHSIVFWVFAKKSRKSRSGFLLRSHETE